MATYHEQYGTYTYTDEAKTYLAFPTDSHFAKYRETIHQRYSAAMVGVSRHKVYKDGYTVAVVDHASNLGAELRGLAVQFGGSSEHTYTKG